jgi:molybdopterin molybdotransferase
LVIGLPGNPTSAMVTARLLLAPLVAGLGGRDPGAAARWRKARLASGLVANGDRETFVRARSIGDSVAPLGDQDSGAQKSLSDADLLIRRAAGAPALAEGSIADVIDF